MNWIYVGAAIAAVMLLAAVGTFILKRRRRQRPASELGSGPHPPLPAFGDWGLSADPVHGAAPYDSVRPMETPFTRAEFFFEATPTATTKLDPRRQAALEQGVYLRKGEEQVWRQSAHGRFLQGDDGRETFRLDQPVFRLSAEEALRSLIERGCPVSEQLGSAVDRVSLRWPSDVVVAFDGGIEGYIAEGLAPEFLADGRNSQRTIRTLDFALGDPGRRGAPMDAAGRLQLVRSVAAWVRALHAEDVVHGSLSFKSVAYAADDLRVAALDYGTARVMGRGPWHNLSASPEGGTDRLRASSLDDDRKRFAHLAFALLLPEAQNMEGWLHGHEDVYGLDAAETSRACWLWTRSCGASGTMPTMDEWADVFLTHAPG